MFDILSSYLKKLTNLSTGNRSLLLLRLSSEQDIDIHTLDYLQKNIPSFNIIEQLIGQKKKIVLCDIADSRDPKVNEASKKIKAIKRKEEFIFEERGGKDLYMGWPFVQGKLSDGTMVRCPLMFFPVELSIVNEQWVIKQREEEQISFNKSFLLAYAHYNEIALEDDFYEFNFNEFETDSQIFRTRLYELLKDSSLKINFNQDIFLNKLIDFKNFKKNDYEELYGNGELKLMPEAVLGIFPQADSFLVPDYEEIINSNTYKDLEEFFENKTNPEDKNGVDFRFLKKLKEEQTFTPYKIDASQENALKAIKKGNSLVVQGPPGTGKSQLICNLIADYIARGKNVLLVSQKKAALDVVYERLKELELQDFIGLVHDFKNDRNAIYKKIDKQINRLEEYKFKNNSLDSIVLEREFIQASKQIDHITEELEEFRNALYDATEFGISVKELYLTSDPNQPSVNLKHEHKHFRAEDLKPFEQKAATWLRYALKFKRPDYLWNDRVSFKDFTVSDNKELLRLLDHIPYFQSEISDNLQEVLNASLDLDDGEWIYDRKEQIHQMLHLLEDPLTYENFIYVINKNTNQNWLLIREKLIIECFKGEGLEMSIEPEQLVQVQQAVEKASKANKQLHKWIYWRLFSKEKFLVKRAFVSNGLEWNREGFRILKEKIDNRLNLEHNLTELKEAVWLLDVPEDYKLETFQNWIHHQHVALAAKDILTNLRNLKDFINVPSLSFKKLKKKLLRTLEIISPINEEKKYWRKYLTTRQISKILADYEYPIQIAAFLKRDFEELVDFDRMESELKQYERDVLEKLLKTVPVSNIEKGLQIFNNSIKLEWIDHIESKNPILRMVSSLKMENTEKELQEKIKDKLKLSKDILLLKIRERTYKNINYNRLNNMVTYRDLSHQVTKKKKIWPIRKLLSSYSHEVFELMPCWFASPESVSAIFPMESMFDLVIFDEASQCYAEKGIPAMYRAKQVVITGDDKQLSPSDLYNVRWEEEEKDIPDLEVDSLLDLSKKYLMQVNLMGHYRSRSPELINFSNHHFYNDKLKLLPERTVINENEPAINYIKVDGLWENNTNKEEALKVVGLVEDYIKKDAGKSIGIVTFNFKQQTLIRDILEERAIEKQYTLPESLFVKNIENVQGDERDIIIFSIGYAPDKNGRLAMHFGSLNAAKGENRLNVAITRAKYKIYIVSSIMPDQMNVESAKNEGPRLLKKYLKYAFNISQGKNELKAPKEESHNVEWFLKKKIIDNNTMENMFLEEELPFADLTLKTKDEYLGLIITDDNLYHQALSIKEFHAYNHLSLKEKKWKMIKFFSRQYWEDKEKINDKIIKSFKNVKD